MTLDIDSVGQIFTKCQVTDYTSWVEALSSNNMLNFFVDTYEANVSWAERDQNTGNNDDNSEGSDMDDHGREPRWPHHNCVHYLPHHPKVKQKQWVLHSQGHCNLPNFVRCYFPWHDDPKIYTFYCTCMLLLLKP